MESTQITPEQQNNAGANAAKPAPDKYSCGKCR